MLLCHDACSALGRQPSTLDNHGVLARVRDVGAARISVTTG
jgi:hypothetical protein